MEKLKKVIKSLTLAIIMLTLTSCATYDKAVGTYVFVGKVHSAVVTVVDALIIKEPSVCSPTQNTGDSLEPCKDNTNGKP